MVWWFMNWLMRKKEEKTLPEDLSLPQQVKEPPSNLPPAEVEMIMKYGKEISLNSFLSTLFVMTEKNLIKINPDFTLSLNQNFNTNLMSLKNYEKMVLNLLFAGRENISLQMIKNIIAEKNFRKWQKKWQKEIKKELEKLHLYDEESLSSYKRSWITTFIAALLTLNPFLLLAGLYFNQNLKRVSARWKKEAFLWQAFKNYLDNFSEYSQLPLNFAKQIETYLAFGVLFNNADKIISFVSQETEALSLDPAVFSKLSVLAKSLSPLSFFSNSKK